MPEYEIIAVEVLNGGTYISDHYDFSMEPKGDILMHVKGTLNGIWIPLHQIVLVRYVERV